METEHLEKRFGITAIKKGYVSADQFIDALKIQVMEDISTGKHRLVGRILLEQGLMSFEQIEDVLESIGKGIPLLKESKTA